MMKFLGKFFIQSFILYFIFTFINLLQNGEWPSSAVNEDAGDQNTQWHLNIINITNASSFSEHYEKFIDLNATTFIIFVDNCESKSDIFCSTFYVPLSKYLLLNVLVLLPCNPLLLFQGGSWKKRPTKSSTIILKVLASSLFQHPPPNGNNYVLVNILKGGSVRCYFLDRVPPFHVE